MNNDIKCCKKRVKLVLAWDDAQETDHAYNLYLCEQCGTLYKDDLWNDKGLRALYLDGTLVKAGSDEEWEESGLLKGLEGEHRALVAHYLRLAQLKVAVCDDRHTITLFPVVRRVLRDLWNHERREELLARFDFDELYERNKERHESGESEERVKQCYFAIDAEVEMTAELSDELVKELVDALP